MSYPTHRTVHGVGVICEPTGTHTHSVWFTGSQPQQETFYGLSRMARRWTVVRYTATDYGVAFEGFPVCQVATRNEAIEAAVIDYLSKKEAAA